MLLKLILLVVAGVIIYVTLKKYFGVQPPKNETSAPPPRKDMPRPDEVMVECHTCHTFVESKEALLKEGRFYCSHECAKIS